MSSSSLAPPSPSPSKAAKSRFSPSKLKGGVKKLVKGLRRSVSKLHLRSRSEGQAISQAPQAPVSISHSEVRPGRRSTGPLTSTSTIIIPVTVFASVPITVPVSPRPRYSSTSLSRSHAKHAKASSDGNSSRDDSSSVLSQPVSLVSRTRSHSLSYSTRSSPTSSISEEIPPVPPLPPSIVARRAPTPGPTPTLEAFSAPLASIPPADVVQPTSQPTISSDPVIGKEKVTEAEIIPLVAQVPTEVATPVIAPEVDTNPQDPILTKEDPFPPVEEAEPTATFQVEPAPSEKVKLPIVEQAVPAATEEPQQVSVSVEVEKETTPIEESAMVDHPVSDPVPVEEPSSAPPPLVEEEQVAQLAFTPSSQALAPIVIEPEVPDPFIIDDADQPLSEEDEPTDDNLSPVVTPADVDVNDAAPSDIPIPPEDDTTQVTVSSGSVTEEDNSPDSDVPEDEIALTQSVSVQPESGLAAATTAPAIPIPTADSRSTEPEPSPLSPSIVDKPLPTPAPAVVPSPGVVSTSDEDEDEEDYEIILPGVNVPTMFLPIPNTDPLTTLLTKYISPDKRPHRDLTGEWQKSEFHSLVMTNSWRALARMARDRIVATDPEDTSLILSLWYLRLSSLARLRLFNQTSAELSNLYTILTSPSLPRAHSDFLFEKLVPFELEVLRAKVKYWSGDQMAYLDELVRLIKRCKKGSRKACGGGGSGSGIGKSDKGNVKKEGKKGGRDEVAIDMWKERGTRLCLILASQLIEMKDYIAATSLLTPLLSPPKGTTRSPNLVSAIGRIYLQSGLLKEAARLFTEVAQDSNASFVLKSTNAALLAAAEGEWEKATALLKGLVERDEDNFVAANNLAVVLLSQGHLKEGIDLLEDALRSSPASITTAEPILFNLSTLYELRSNTAADKKRELLIEVAKWAGDGLRTTCLKMPSS